MPPLPSYHLSPSEMRDALAERIRLPFHTRVLTREMTIAPNGKSSAPPQGHWGAMMLITRRLLSTDPGSLAWAFLRAPTGRIREWYVHLSPQTGLEIYKGTGRQRGREGEGEIKREKRMLGGTAMIMRSASSQQWSGP